MDADNSKSNNNKIDISLQKLVKGTSLVLIGSIIGYFLIFVSGVLIARNWTEHEVGIYALSLSVFAIGTTLSNLGTPQGVVRCIAHSRGKKEIEKIPDFIMASVFYCVLFSIIIAIFIIIFSDFLSIDIFGEPSLSGPLKLTAIALPFTVFNTKIASIYRGFEIIKPYVYFVVLLENVLYPIFLAIVIFYNSTFIYVFYTDVLAVVVTTIAILVYISKFRLNIPKISFRSIFSPTAKELFIFSLPLLGSAILDLIISQTGTIMLGTYKTTADVGFFNVARPFAIFISVPLTALLVTYIPIFSNLFAKGKIEEMKKNYLFSTKWISIITLPIFTLFFVYSELIISILLGPNYLPSAPVLRILSLVFIISNFTGPCGATILALGNSRFIMFCSLIGVVINVTLCLLLIPNYSYLGAAIALNVTYNTVMFIKVIKMYLLTKIKPFGINLIKPAILFSLLVIPMYIFYKNYLSNNWYSLIIIFVLLYVAITVSVIITKSIEENDIQMLLALERKTGFNATKIKKLLSRFI